MLDNGWYPSDIARCEPKFESLQSINILQMMDKSLPFRDHTKRTEFFCTTYQTDMEHYHVGHCEESCPCGDELFVDEAELTRVLHRGDQIPLL